jgi:MFS superfamily sulfate permease-like transporter
MLIAQTSRPMVLVLGREPSTEHFVGRVRNPATTGTPGALVVRSTSTWLYFNAEHIRRQVVDMVHGAPAGIRTVVLDFSSVPAIDITAANAENIDSEHDLGPVVAHQAIEDCFAG